jgi:hypothetical protein
MGYFLLYLAAAILFALAAFGVAIKTINLIAVGLFCWVLVSVIASWPG